MPTDNRTTLLDCALHLFAARGYDAVGVQEIVEAAGVTKPTLYHYFGSKRGLLDALLDTHFVALNDCINEAAAYNGDLPYTLRQIVLAYFQFAQAESAFYRLQLGMYFAPPESEAYRAVLGYHEQQYATVERVFVQAVEQHGNMRGRHQRYAVSLLGMVNNMISLWLNGYLDLDNTLLYNILHQFMHGIYS
jgi:AcrR family transcriptional regulator